VILHRKRKCNDTQPSSLPDIRRVSTIKIFGVTISNKLSVNDHVSNIVSKCSQTLYALTTLRAHGLCNTALQAVFRSVGITGLLYACSAWWGYASSSDRQRIAAFIRRGARRGFCSPDLPCIEELVSGIDDTLFNCILSDKHHVLYQLLPPERDCGYTLRPRKHERCLINKSRLDEQNFMYKLLFKDMY